MSRLSKEQILGIDLVTIQFDPKKPADPASFAEVDEVRSLALAGLRARENPAPQLLKAVKTTRIEEHHLPLGRATLIALLRAAGHDVPGNATLDHRVSVDEDGREDETTRLLSLKWTTTTVEGDA